MGTVQTEEGKGAATPCGFSYLIMAWVAGAATCAFLLWYLVKMGSAQVAAPHPIAEVELLAAIYEHALDRIQHFENMMVTIGTVSLAVLAGVSGVVFTKDFSQPAESDQAQNNRTYRAIVILTLLTTVAYTHVFRYYTLTYAYVIELEMRLAVTDTRARMQSAIWHDMTVGVPWMAAVSFTFVGLYSVAISVAMILLFGPRFNQRGRMQLLIAALVVLTAAVYVLPPISRYMAMVDLAQR